MSETTVLAEIRRLRAMTVGELHARYAEVFGEASRSRNKDFLRKRVAWRLQELAEGSIKDRLKEKAGAIACDADLRIVPPPQGRGVPLPEVVALPPADPRLPVAGATLTRQFGGKTHEVKVLQEGYEYEGRAFKSLSAVAREITGTRWNGLSFFKLPTTERDA